MDFFRSCICLPLFLNIVVFNSVLFFNLSKFCIILNRMIGSHLNSLWCRMTWFNDSGYFAFRRCPLCIILLISVT
jgi:hypothetical protein